MSGRLNSIDFMRGLAIIFMIQVHIYYHWIFWTKVDYGFAEDLIFLIGSFAAPLFLAVSGASYFFYFKNNSEKKVNNKNLFLQIIKRGFFIFIIPTLLQILFGNLLKMGSNVILYWSVFQVIAISMILFFPILIYRNKWQKMFIGIFFIMIIILSILIDFYDIWFLFFLTSGVFEFLPWTNYFLFGLFLGKVFDDAKEIFINKEMVILLSLGFLLFLLGLKAFLKYRIIDDLRLEFHLMSFGILILISISSLIFLDILKVENFITKSFIQWGKLAFSIYYVQYIIIGFGIIIFPLTITEIYISGFNPLLFFISFFAFILLIELSLRIWKRYEFKLSIEWLMNKFIQKSLLFKKEEQFETLE